MGSVGDNLRMPLIPRLRARLFPRPKPIPPDSPLHVHPYDREHGTDTSGLILTGDPALTANSGAYTSVYLGISPSTLRQALRELALDPGRFTFIDIGCGKGRALLVASELPFPRLTGVEFSPELCAIARANLARLPAAGARTEIVHGDATTFTLPEGPLLLFLYDSFHADVLPRFLSSLEAQLRSAPREVWVLYAANGLTEIFARFPFLELISDRQIPLSPEDAEIDQRAFNLQFPPGADGRPRHRITHERYTVYRSRL